MRKLPPLATLRAFEAAARHLSFKNAARELGVTPTAVSHQIRLLEETCGRELFRRQPRPLTLTGVGERLYPVLRQGFDSFASAFASISQDIENAPLRVTSTNAFASRWLIPRLPLWRGSYPDIPLEVIGTDAVLDLRGGEADVALRYAATMPRDLAGQELFRDSFFPVCTPDLLKATGRPPRVAELLSYPLLHFEWMKSDPVTPNWQRWLATARTIDPDLPEMNLAWSLSFREELHGIEAAIAGQGIAICSNIVVSGELESGTLVKAHDLSLPGFGYYLVHTPEHPRLPAISAFAAWMRSMAALG
ncbi:MAG: LysR substrate-binding domain-containing protein [Pseudomonadota bacterium]